MYFSALCLEYRTPRVNGSLWLIYSSLSRFYNTVGGNIATIGKNELHSIMQNSIMMPAAISLLLFLSGILANENVEMKNTFNITSWDESPYSEFNDGAKFSRATVKKTYSGLLSGDGELDYLMAYDNSGAAYFTGIEHFSGNVEGKVGTISMTHQGTFSNGRVSSSFVIIDGSQTGELIGLSGKGSYESGHAMSVDFDLSIRFED